MNNTLQITKFLKQIQYSVWTRLTVKELYVIFIILTLEEIIVLNKYCTYNKPIPKILHVKSCLK